MMEGKPMEYKFTIGEVAKILGVSTDTLRHYEDKGILHPSKSEKNNYREYNAYDIYDVMTTRFYRKMDISISDILTIRENSEIDDIEKLMDNKYEEILDKMHNYQILLEKIQNTKKACEDIKKYLNMFTIRAMDPIVVVDTLSDFRAFDEYKKINKHKKKIDNNESMLLNFKRYLKISDKGIIQSKMIVTQKVVSTNMILEHNDKMIISYPKCVYTVVEDGRYRVGERNIDQEMNDKIKEWIQQQGFEITGELIIGTLVVAYKNNLERTFLEIYIPIK